MKRDARNRRRYVQVLREPHRQRSHSHKLYRKINFSVFWFLLPCVAVSLKHFFLLFRSLLSLLSFLSRVLSFHFSRIRTHSYRPSLLFLWRESRSAMYASTRTQIRRRITRKSKYECGIAILVIHNWFGAKAIFIAPVMSD